MTARNWDVALTTVAVISAALVLLLMGMLMLMGTTSDGMTAGVIGAFMASVVLIAAVIALVLHKAH